MRVRLQALALCFSIVGCGGEFPSHFEELSVRTQEIAHQGQRSGQLRIMAANITAGSAQSYDTGEGKRIFQGLRPDIALIQELNVGENSEPELRAFVDEAFGADYVFFRESGAQIPNGIVSRFPILSSGQWDDPHVANRDFAWARIDLPGSRELFAVSVHFSAGNNSVRTAQAQTLVERLQEELPPGDLLVVGGDLNVGSGPPIHELGRLLQASAEAPADLSGNVNTNASRKKRLDWVLSDAALESLEVPLEIGEHRFPNGLVFDSRRFQPLNLVEPVEPNDSGAKNMQHMPVMRAFALPLDAR